MRLKLFRKLFFTIGTIIVVSFTIIATILSFAISNYFSEEKYTQLRDNCDSIAVVAVTDMNSENFRRNIYNIIGVQNNVSNVDIFISDTAGKIVVCGCDEFINGQDCMHSVSTVSRVILDTARDGEYFEVGNFNRLYEEDFYTVGIPLKSADGTVLGYVFSSTTTESLRVLMDRVFEMCIISAVFPIIIMFIAVYTMTYRFTKPLKLMSDAAHAMAKGDFSKRIPVMSDDEIGELSVSFNNMTNSLAKLEKMRRSFVGNVSHELRTPMTTIGGFIDGILDGTIEEERREYYLRIISDEVKRLSRVVESMLNLSRLESGEVKLNPIMFNLSEAVVSVVLSREKQIDSKKITVTGLDRLEDTFVYADYDLIYQVIYNLVDNAVKFCEDGGEISFSVGSDAKFVRFSVKNTGFGIPKENIGSIFDRFYKVDKSRSANKNSAGLGLYIVKTIINIHGGRITVESAENEYTDFSVQLPIRKQKQ